MISRKEVGEKAAVDQRRSLSLELTGLGLALAINSLLGPLVGGVIEYHFTETLIYQGIALDFVSLVVVAPLCLISATLAFRGRPIARVLGLSLGAYSAYMAVQYAVGPEYQTLPGNNERFFPLHLTLFVLGCATAIRAWTAIDPRTLPPTTRPGHRGLGSLLFVLGLLLVLRYVPPLVQLVAGAPTFPEYQANPTSFLLIAWMDLGVFATTALVAGVSLMRGQAWAKKALYGIVGWLALVGIAVAAMSVTMLVHEDPAVTSGQTIVFLAAAAIFTSLAIWLHWPLTTSTKSDDGSAD